MREKNTIFSGKYNDFLRNSIASIGSIEPVLEIHPYFHHLLLAETFVCWKTCLLIV